MTPSEARLKHMPVRPRCLPYSSERRDTWDGVRAADACEPPDGGGQARAADGGEAKAESPGGWVELLYTGYRVRARPGEEHRAGWCREHAWPQSRGGFDTDSPGPGTDLHNLFAADRSVNSARGKRHYMRAPDGEGAPVVDRSPAPGYGGATLCRSGRGWWEPRDEAKGVVARAAMYMACEYGAAGPVPLRLVPGALSEEPGCLGDLASLLAWNEAFPPGARERRRNSVVETLQGNRNPFIDRPGLALEVDWGRPPAAPSGACPDG